MSNRKCADCGNQLGQEEGYWAEGRKRDVCRECYDDIVSTCQLCRDSDVMPSAVSEFILCKAELTTTCHGARPPGIFRILRRPFLMIPMIGRGSMDGNDVLFVDKLPKFDRHYDISGHICKKCAAPYTEKLTAVYGEKLPSKYGEHGRELWDKEREHTRSTILANPDMLRDLECDSFDFDRHTGKKIEGACRHGWDEIENAYLLPDDLPTYHEWLLLDYKGVKVWKTSRDSVYGDGWLLLKPEPRYRRYAYGGSMNEESWVMFTASSLPTYKHCPDKPLRGQHYTPSPYNWDRQQSLPAIRKAIRLGLLKQNGCFDAKGKPLLCR
jgi:hypothetical protein